MPTRVKHPSGAPLLDRLLALPKNIRQACQEQTLNIIWPHHLEATKKPKCACVCVCVYIYTHIYISAGLWCIVINLEKQGGEIFFLNAIFDLLPSNHKACSINLFTVTSKVCNC